MDAGVRTQVLNWMNKGTTESLSALCINKGQRESARSCLGSETHQGSYESIHQVPGAEVKTIQRLLICRVLWSQGRCSTGCSMTRTEAPGAGAGRGLGWGRWQTVHSSYLSHPVLGLGLVQHGDVLTLIQALGYSSKVETTHRQFIKIQGGKDFNEN